MSSLLQQVFRLSCKCWHLAVLECNGDSLLPFPTLGHSVVNLFDRFDSRKEIKSHCFLSAQEACCCLKEPKRSFSWHRNLSVPSIITLCFVGSVKTLPILSQQPKEKNLHNCFVKNLRHKKMSWWFQSCTVSVLSKSSSVIFVMCSRKLCVSHQAKSLQAKAILAECWRHDWWSFWPFVLWQTPLCWLKYIFSGPQEGDRAFVMYHHQEGGLECN